ALLEIQVKSLIFISTKALMAFSGMPQSPNPPNINVIPSVRPCIASVIFATFLLIILCVYLRSENYEIKNQSKILWDIDWFMYILIDFFKSPTRPQSHPQHLRNPPCLTLNSPH